jgi:hypothetical protein
MLIEHSGVSTTTATDQAPHRSAGHTSRGPLEVVLTQLREHLELLGYDQGTLKFSIRLAEK